MRVAHQNFGNKEWFTGMHVYYICVREIKSRTRKKDLQEAGFFSHWCTSNTILEYVWHIVHVKKVTDQLEHSVEFCRQLCPSGLPFSIQDKEAVMTFLKVRRYQHIHTVGLMKSSLRSHRSRDHAHGTENTLCLACWRGFWLWFWFRLFWACFFFLLLHLK